MADEPPSLSISPEKVCFIIIKAREFDVKDSVSEPDPASNAADDGMRAVLEDHEDDPTGEELRTLIDAMSEDEQVDLVAMAWIGRGDSTLEEWTEVRGEAARVHNRRSADYLLGMPLLADHLEEALSQFGHSCEDYEMGRL